MQLGSPVQSSSTVSFNASFLGEPGSDGCCLEPVKRHDGHWQGGPWYARPFRPQVSEMS